MTLLVSLVTRLPNWSSTLTLTVPVDWPACASEGSAAICSSAAAAGLMVTVAWPVIEPVVVSVAVMVRLPACVRVTPVKVWLPLSALVKV